MITKQAILSITDLSLSFAHDGTEKRALMNVSFELFPQEILGIVGESGSGKSVTALSIMQLLSPQAKIDGGSIVFNDNGRQINLINADEDDLCSIRGNDISMVFQEPMSSLNPSQTCGKQVREAVLIHNKVGRSEAEDRVKTLFEKVELSDVDRIYTSYPHQLSGGQLQRVMIAMALINHPQIIIADEPTTALDVTVQQSILRLLKNISEEYKSSIIFISHDLGVIKQICDRVVVMQEGEVKEVDTVEHIFKHASHPYTQGLIACRPPFDKRMVRLPMVSDFLQRNDALPYIEGLTQHNEEFINHLEYIEKNARPLLQISGVSKSFVKRRNFFGKAIEHFKAVDDVSLQVRQGEIVGLVGESGCGKSTLGRVILRLIEADSGSIHFEGQDVRAMDRETLRKLRKDFQIIFQDPYSSLNPRMKIGDAILEPMDIHHLYNNKNERKERVVELLELVGLDADHMVRYPHQFSGGQRQRICIARTLSLQPKFIVCDESVSALDVSVQAQVLNLLLDLKDKFKLSYLFISHDIGVIKFFCDNVLVMKDGSIVERGNAEDIFHRPKHAYTQKLIEAVPK